MTRRGNSDSDEPEKSRRTFLQWASAAGLTAIAPGTIAEIGEARYEREVPEPVPEEKRGDPASDVHLTHILEKEGVQKQLEQLDRERNPSDLYHPYLKKGLRERDDDEFSIVIRTIGEENTITTNGPHERTIHGWRPTEEEVEALAEYGRVGFTSDFSGTTVTLHDVHRDDLGKVASLDFVVGMTRSVPKVLNGGTASTNSSVIDVSEVRSTDYCWFEDIDGNYEIPTDVKVGIIDTGYEASETPYSTAYSSNVGLDVSLANDFTNDNDWGDDTYSEYYDIGFSHGAGVSDTAAYMLDDDATHDSLFVPLKMWSANTDTSDGEHTDNMRDAIEYSISNEIRVINISGGVRSGADLINYCTSELCDTLESYAECGNIATSSTGNRNETDAVNQPGGSWFTIGTGVTKGECSSYTYKRRDDINSGSNYAPEFYYREPGVAAYCHFCDKHEDIGSSPTVYAPAFETDAGEVLKTTSYATPVTTAAVTIMQANELNSYSEARNICEDMSVHDICPDEAAKTGQLVDAWDAYHYTGPY